MISALLLNRHEIDIRLHSHSKTMQDNNNNAIDQTKHDL